MSAPKILILYYSQSGQLRQILDSILKDIAPVAQVVFAPIQPCSAYPLPWKVNHFFDLMPECVYQDAIPLQPIDRSLFSQDFDLVIFGWQPWFLHPSLPISSFLKSEDARILTGKQVLTVVGSRNMWLNAGEKVKAHFQRLGAKQIGNLVFEDSNTNLISILTIIRWAFKGKKEAGTWLPEAGVQQADIHAAQRFGQPILAALQSKEGMDNLHAQLCLLDAVKLNAGLIILEQRGIKNFRFWAKYIKEKGASGAPERLGRVKAFKRLLIVAIFILSPISSLTAFIQQMIQRKKLREDVAYFKGISYESGRM